MLNEEGTIRGDVYVLCSIDGYYLLSEDISAAELIASMNTILEKAEELDIQSMPEIQDMRENNWGQSCSKAHTPGRSCLKFMALT